MSGIEDFERRIINQGMTEEDFVEYKKLLNRVQSNYSKRQHCYTTAIQFPQEYAEQAIKLIKYGLENFDDGWFTTYTSHLYIGHIYESIANYQKAFDHFLLAKSALGADHPDYEKELSLDLLWMKLHIDSFRYSEELKGYYACYEKTDGFSKSLVNNEFKMVVAKIVIALHNQNIEEARNLLKTAKEMCKSKRMGKLYDLLHRHNYQESFKTTPEAVNFIKKIQI